jgi:hypothetical protein
LKSIDSWGKASKEIIYSQLPHFDVACIFKSTQKRPRGRGQRVRRRWFRQVLV